MFENSARFLSALSLLLLPWIAGCARTAPPPPTATAVVGDLGHAQLARICAIDPSTCHARAVDGQHRVASLEP